LILTILLTFGNEFPQNGFKNVPLLPKRTPGIPSRRASSGPISEDDRLRVGWLKGIGRGSASAEDAQGTPTQSHTLPNILEHTKVSVQVRGGGRVLLLL
jgi:hypothetical protein